jgi:hypothetical protein
MAPLILTLSVMNVPFHEATKDAEKGAKRTRRKDMTTIMITAQVDGLLAGEEIGRARETTLRRQLLRQS